MAHEPLGTDEKLDEPVKKRYDMDSTFLAGCFTIATLSIMVLAMVVWPFVVFQIHTNQGLINIGLMGLLPALLLGALAVRLLGVTGATGFAGGAFASGVFTYLRLDQVSLGRLGNIENFPPPEFPAYWVWLLPLVWCLLVAAVILVLLPKREFEDQAEDGLNR